MAHVIEPAAGGRAKCRGCGVPIDKGVLRFGERLPNPFADGADQTQWFHLVCAAYKRPEPLLEALAAADAPAVENKDWLVATAEVGVAHRRLPRIDGAQRASSGRAACRCCRETIDKGAWRIKLVFWEDGQFQPSGFVHLSCAEAYFETKEVLERALHFSPGLVASDVEDLTHAVRAAG